MRLLFDEDFNQRIVRGLLRRIPSLDARSAHDGDLAGATDDEILVVAAAENRLLVSHDVNTMTAAFNARVAEGTAVPGLVLVPQKLAVGSAILDLELICVPLSLRTGQDESSFCRCRLSAVAWFANPSCGSASSAPSGG